MTKIDKRRKAKSKGRAKSVNFNDLQCKVSKDYPWKVLKALTHDLREFLTVDDVEHVFGLCRNRDVDGYRQLSVAWGLQSIAPTLGTGSAQSTARLQLASVFKKYSFPSDVSPAERQEAAMEKFLAAERECHKFNTFTAPAIRNEPHSRLALQLKIARDFIERLIGPEACFSGPNSVFEDARHGPGASTQTREGFTGTYHKVSEIPYHVTEGASCYARFLISQDERLIDALEDDLGLRPTRIDFVDKWGQDDPGYLYHEDQFWPSVLSPVKGNRITFVPKDSQIDRPIAIEPTENLRLQLGVDGVIRRSLRKIGIDLNDQTINQRLAMQGSVTGQLATIDLSSASDTISCELCHLLLPVHWYHYLTALRSPVGGRKGDEEILYEKISSMGNGYTFALESLIFASLVHAAYRSNALEPKWGENAAVYGDDIIIDVSVVDEVISLLRVCGFAVNDEKSFTEGFVRESCGADFVSGHPVRPVFLRETPENVFDVWSAMNRLRRTFALRYGIVPERTLKVLQRWIPVKCRHFVGPCSDTDFDSYLHVPDPPENSIDPLLWSYKFLRLVRYPRRYAGQKFLYRKLMASLKPRVDRSHRLATWAKIVGRGSVFTVTKRNAWTVGVGSSHTNHWCDEYIESYSLNE